jgi:hypothetical protein
LLRAAGQLFPGIEVTSDPTAIHIQFLEDIQHFLHLAPGKDILGPEDDVQILFEDFQAVENRVDHRRSSKLSLEQSEIFFLKLDPARLALEMLDPPLAEEPVPMLENPELDRVVPQVPSFPLALNPLEALGFFPTITLQAHLSFGECLNKMS